MITKFESHLKSLLSKSGAGAGTQLGHNWDTTGTPLGELLGPPRQRPFPPPPGGPCGARKTLPKTTKNRRKKARSAGPGKIAKIGEGRKHQKRIRGRGGDDDKPRGHEEGGLVAHRREQKCVHLGPSRGGEGANDTSGSPLRHR